MNKVTIHITVCIDHGFVMPTGVMMYSVCTNNPEVDIRFHVIYDDSITEEDKNDLRETVIAFSGKEMAFYHINHSRFPSFPNLSGQMTCAAYYRLMLSEILPKDLSKVLYLDGDLIVRHSLLPLWNVELHNLAVAAVSDSNDCAISFYNRLRYPISSGYFNSGVMLVNLDYWRENEVFKGFIRYIRDYPERIYLWDQDVLNYYFHDKKFELPIRFNLQRGHLIKYNGYDYWRREQEITEARRDPVIVHFTMEKPWNKYLYQPAHPFSNTFYKYQELTKWKGVKIDKRSRMKRFKNYVSDMLLRRCGLMSPRKILFYSDFISIEPID